MDLDPRLAALAAQIMADIPGGAPPPPPPTAPGPGQSRADWLAEVDRIRRAHDALADILAVHMGATGPEVGSVRDHLVPVAGGTITARVYTPVSTGPHAGIAFFHGGAWWLAGGEKGFALTDEYCRAFCASLSAVVVNVDYRLAPEFAFPAQLEDSYAGLQWLTDHAAELDVDPARISVMGASSGGNQAAAVCLLARERGGPAITSQVLHVPVLDLTGGSPSLRDDPGWEGLNQIMGLYATVEQRHDPLVSPLLAPDLGGLPPAVIVTGAFDPLRDDGQRYAARLEEAGVTVRLLEYPMFHNIALPETTTAMFAEMADAVGQFDRAVG